IDLEPWGGFRFGSLRPDKAGVENLKLNGSLYSVTTGGETILNRGDRELFRASGPIVVRDWRMDPELQFRLKTANQPVEIVIPSSQQMRSDQVDLEIDGKVALKLFPNKEGHIKFTARKGQHTYRLLNKH